jgi:hypothetical protein
MSRASYRGVDVHGGRSGFPPGASHPGTDLFLRKPFAIHLIDFDSTALNLVL